MSDVVGDPIVERASKAIWLADDRDEAWGEGSREYYDRLARAAIEALGLTEQWGSVIGYQTPAGHPSKKEAEEHVAYFRRLCEEAGMDRRDHVVRRFVSPWERVGGDA